MRKKIQPSDNASDALKIRRVELNYKAQKWDQVYSTARTLIRYGALVWGLYYVWQIAASLAGTETKAIFEVLLKLSADRWIAYTASLLFGSGYVYERRARRKAIKDMGGTIKKLERQIDRERSSSRLSETGDPRSEDSHDP